MHIKEFSFAFFIPVYFAIVGLKLDLLHSFDALFFLGFFAFAVLAQGIAVFLASKFLGYSRLSSFNLAVAMNARGGPGIVLATITYDIGIISENFFVSLVMLSIVTSLLAGSWIRYVLSKDWKLIDASKNMPGIDVVNVKNLNVEALAPGTKPGRITLWTDKAIDVMEKEKIFLE